MIDPKKELSCRDYIESTIRGAIKAILDVPAGHSLDVSWNLDYGYVSAYWCHGGNLKAYVRRNVSGIVWDLFATVKSLCDQLIARGLSRRSQLAPAQADDSHDPYEGVDPIRVRIADGEATVDLSGYELVRLSESEADHGV